MDLAAIEQMQQGLRTIDPFQPRGTPRPGRDRQHVGQVHPVLQSGRGPVPTRVEIIGRGNCLYSTMLAYFGTTQVCGQLTVEVLATASASGLGRSTVNASSQTRLNMPESPL